MIYMFDKDFLLAYYNLRKRIYHQHTWQIETKKLDSWNNLIIYWDLCPN
jgi:hypothetical protein